MESSYRAGDFPAPPHFHPSQQERFRVLSGAVRVAIDGTERTLREGEELTIEAGTPHEMGGDPDEDGRVRWEVRPALRTREFCEGLFAMLEATASRQAGEEAPDVIFDVADYADVFRLAEPAADDRG